MSTLNFKNQEYKDFDFDFNAHPKTGDVSVVKNEDAIKQSIINLVNLAPYDKPYQPKIFSRISGLLFEPMTQMTASSLESVIKSLINNYEPRVTVEYIEVNLKPMDYLYEVYIQFIVHNPSIQKLDIEMFLKQGT